MSRPVVTSVPSLIRSGVGAALFSVFCASGCQKTPTDLREWSPKDHTNTSNKPAEQTGQVNANPAPTETPPKGLDPVTLATWGAQCSSCHGKVGRGDGPNGKMLKATDLSQPDWQAQVTDEQIQKSITSGKNAMPAFSNLPAETVDNLVWLVRWFNSDQTAVQARMERLKVAGSATATPARSSSGQPTLAPAANTSAGAAGTTTPMTGPSPTAARPAGR